MVSNVNTCGNLACTKTRTTLTYTMRPISNASAGDMHCVDRENENESERETKGELTEKKYSVDYDLLVSCVVGI